MYEIAEAIRDTIANGICSTTYEGQQVQFCVVGNPPTFPRYPAISVELMGNDNQHQGMGVGWISQEHKLTITVWTDAATYDASYRLRAKLATTIESRLFRTVFPLVKPYLTSPLSTPASAGQTWLSLASGQGFLYPYDDEPLSIYLSVGRNRYPAQFIRQLDDTTFQLGAPLTIDLPILNSLAIRPLVAVYDSYCEGINYDNGADKNLLLLYATIDYRLKTARQRYGEPFGT